MLANVASNNKGYNMKRHIISGYKGKKQHCIHYKGYCITGSAPFKFCSVHKIGGYDSFFGTLREAINHINEIAI